MPKPIEVDKVLISGERTVVVDKKGRIWDHGRIVNREPDPSQWENIPLPIDPDTVDDE